MIKNKHFLTLAFAASFAMLACGGSDDPDDPIIPEPQPPTPTVQGKFLTMTKELTAQAGEENMALTGLTSAITTMAGQNATASWLTVIKEEYTGGTPRVTLQVTENLQTAERQAYIVFVASRDTLALTVKQGVYSGGTDVNNPNDTPTDQPAYVRQLRE